MSEATVPEVVRNVETEYLEMNGKNAWGILFQHITSECSSQSASSKYTFDESKKPQNKILNRYRDVSPYDHTRVILNNGACDYINANNIKMDEADRKYILTQGPLEATAGHFWLMAWEQNSKAIIMLNKIIEKDQIKCHQYWPLTTSYNASMVFTDVNLEVECLRITEKSDYRTSTLRLSNLETHESREILHFHYTTWPDFGVPQSPTAFLRFLHDVRASGALDSTVGPPIVHCSAGIGRSGTFCLVDTCLVLIEKNGLNSVNVRSVLLEMRGMRMGLIQTPDQLRFSYIAIIEGYKQSSNLNLDNNELLINHYDTVSNDISNNSSLEEEDEPPPLPPPRGDSLTRSMMADLTPSPVSETENGTGPPNKPLPMEPPISAEIRNNSTPANSNSIYDNNTNNTSNNDFTTNASSSHDAKNELRHRQQDKKDRLAAQVREMKRRQEQMEDWQKLKRSLFNPLTIGIGSVIIGGGMVAICGYIYLRG